MPNNRRLVTNSLTWHTVIIWLGNVMKLTRSNFFAALKAIFLLAGFVVGLLAGADDSNSLTVVEGIIFGPITILIWPPLVVLLFRLDVAVGFFKPP